MHLTLRSRVRRRRQMEKATDTMFTESGGEDQRRLRALG